MRDRIRSTLLFLALTLAPAAASAQQTIYVCEIDNKKAGSWVPPNIIITHEAGANKGLVQDGLIAHFIDPNGVTAKITDDETKLVASWRLKTVRNRSGQIAQFAFRATYFKDSNRIQVRAQPLGYRDVFSGRGSCERRAGS